MGFQRHNKFSCYKSLINN